MKSMVVMTFGFFFASSSLVLPTDDCIGVTCAIKSSSVCPTLTENDCDSQFNACDDDSDCAIGFLSIRNVVGSRDAHYPAGFGQAGNTTVCFTGESTVCSQKKRCSKCSSKIGSGDPFETYCVSPSTATWQTNTSFSKFNMTGFCTGSLEP
jgi:hypothetical protein